MKNSGDNPVFEKSKRFSVRIVKLYQYMTGTLNEHVMSKQVLRSGTSIGANIAEGIFAVSKKDFLTKFQIALKECHETEYWLELLHDTKYLTDQQFQSVYNDCIEIKSLLISITSTSKRNIEAEKKTGMDKPA